MMLMRRSSSENLPSGRKHVSRQKVLYLDQNAWIALACGAWDRDEHRAEHAALVVVGEAVEAGRIIVPLSFTNIYETMKIDLPVRRAHLAHVLTTLSGGKVLRGRRRILEAMLLRQIGLATGVPVPPLAKDWFLSDLWFEAVAEYGVGPFANEISPAILDHIQQTPQQALFTYMLGENEAVRKEVVRRYTADSQALIARLEARRHRLAGETFALRLRAYAAQLMIEELEYMLALGRRCGLRWFELADIGGKLAKSLISDVPILEVERQLTVRLEDQKRATNENDLRDMSAFMTALPLVDIMVAEKQFVNLSRQAKLDNRYETLLLTSVYDLTPQMLAPSAQERTEG
jgi:hypothetical protein